ncbi:MAG: AAA family ATPase [Janthinobacterium lividum]
MRRRGKRGPNNSEATGKIGQEIPQDQPAALQPNYPDAPKRKSAEPKQTADDLQAAAESAGDTGAEPEEDTAPGKIVVETQPETVGAPVEPPAMAAGDKAAPRGYVVLAIGLPGSGKTTWYKRRGVTPLSSDLLRTILFDDITDQRYSGLVFSTLRSLLRARLIAKMPWNYVDATNLSAHERRQWIKMAKSFGYEAQAVYFDVPLAVCMERNSGRERRVADDIMEKMAERLRPPSFKEGFSKITVVRVKGMPGSVPHAEPTAEAFNAPVPTDEEEPISSELTSPDVEVPVLDDELDSGENGEPGDSGELADR